MEREVLGLHTTFPETETELTEEEILARFGDTIDRAMEAFAADVGYLVLMARRVCPRHEVVMPKKVDGVNYCPACYSEQGVKSGFARRSRMKS